MISLRKILTEQTPAEQAKAMGLVSIGFGRWKDQKTGKVTHRTVGDRLVPAERQPKVVKGARDLASDTSDTNDRRPSIRSMWNDPNASYGPALKNVPRIANDLLYGGKYTHKPIEGRVADIYLPVGIGIKEALQKITGIDDGDSRAVGLKGGADIEASQANYTGNPEALFDDIENYPMVAHMRSDNILHNLRQWVVAVQDDVAGKTRFVDLAKERLPTRIGIDRPLLRGIPVYSNDLGAVMEDFEVGSEITFPDAYSLTPSPNVAAHFSSKGHFTAGTNRIGIIFRVHPGEDGKIEGVDVHKVADAYSEAIQKLDKESNNIEVADHALYSISNFSHEKEVLAIPTSYRVTGMVRIQAKPTRRGDDDARVIMIDLQELPQEASEATLPAAPSISKQAPKKIGQATRKLLSMPLTPRPQEKT